MGKLGGEQGDDQYGLFPFGMEPELCPQVLPILIENMECGDSASILGKIGDGLSPVGFHFTLFNVNLFLCQLPHGDP